MSTKIIAWRDYNRRAGLVTDVDVNHSNDCNVAESVFQAKYRDRARERRELFGQPDSAPPGSKRRKKGKM